MSLSSHKQKHLSDDSNWRSPCLEMHMQFAESDYFLERIDLGITGTTKLLVSSWFCKSRKARIPFAIDHVNGRGAK